MGTGQPILEENQYLRAQKVALQELVETQRLRIEQLEQEAKALFRLAEAEFETSKLFMRPWLAQFQGQEQNREL
jgi:hypothetical protein